MRPIDVMMVPQLNNASQERMQEHSKPMHQQENLAFQNEKQVSAKSEQVTKKTDIDNRGKKFDAREQGSNQYKENSSKQKDKKEDDGRVFLKQGGESLFDMKI